MGVHSGWVARGGVPVGGVQKGECQWVGQVIFVAVAVG